MSEALWGLSRVVSHVLRHEPWLHESELHGAGWVGINDLMATIRFSVPVGRRWIAVRWNGWWLSRRSGATRSRVIAFEPCTVSPAGVVAAGGGGAARSLVL